MSTATLSLAPEASAFPDPALTAAPDTRPPGWRSDDVPQCMERLAAIFAVSRELMRTEAAWLAGVPYWDAKQAIARHVLEDARHTEAMLKRLHELKIASAEHRRIDGLAELVRDVAGARHGDEWLRVLYTIVKPWFSGLIAAYLDASDPVMDEPTRALLAEVLAGQRRQMAWFADYTPRFSEWELADTAEWCDYVTARFAGVKLEEGGFAATARPQPPAGHAPFQGIASIRRDRTFRVGSKSSLPREGKSYAEKRFLVFYNHTQEMQFAESLCAILYESGEMPWAFHHDLARHMADEVRHATMGQARLEQLGVALTGVPMLTQHYEFRANLDPLERFCLMTMVMEATAFERKRANVELFETAGDRVSALYESYDIKDEMLHTNLGHLWVPVMLRVYHDSRTVPELVEHCRSQIAQIISEYPVSAATMANRR